MSYDVIDRHIETEIITTTVNHNKGKNMIIFHVAMPEDWELCEKSGIEYVNSTRGKSLAEEKFIHCAYKQQVPQILKSYYSDVSQVYILEIDTNRLESEVKSEPGKDGRELFPHIYGPINRFAILSVLDSKKWLSNFTQNLND